MKELCFCYVIDGNSIQLEMMKRSVFSIHKQFEKYGCKIYIISLVKDGSEEDKRILSVMRDCGLRYEVVHFNPLFCEMIAFPINAQELERLGYNTIARFFIPYLLDIEMVYYVDTDILFVKDIYHKLTNFDVDNTLMRIWKGHHYDNPHATDHINSGFIFMNLKMWRKRKHVFADILQYFIKNQLSIRYTDQDCITWLTSDRYKDVCIVEDDILVNNRNIFDGVEMYHAVGDDKSIFFNNFEIIWKD